MKAMCRAAVLVALAQPRSQSATHRDSCTMRMVWITSFALWVCCLTPGARAALITLEPTAAGSIWQQQTCGRPGCFSLKYTSINPLDDLGFQFATEIGSSSVITSVGYVVFDLSGLAQNAQGASLELDLRYATNANPNLVMRALSATTVADLVTNPAGTQSGAIDFSTSPPSFPPLYSQLGGQYFAISEGTELGILSQPGPFEGLYLVDLTSSALSLINASSGLFGLGITWTPNTGDQFPSGSDLLSFNAPPRLILSDSNVPLPGTAWLLLPAIFLLLRGQRVTAQRFLPT